VDRYSMKGGPYRKRLGRVMLNNSVPGKKRDI